MTDIISQVSEYILLDGLSRNPKSMGPGIEGLPIIYVMTRHPNLDPSETDLS